MFTVRNVAICWSSTGYCILVGERNLRSRWHTIQNKSVYKISPEQLNENTNMMDVTWRPGQSVSDRNRVGHERGMSSRITDKGQWGVEQRHKEKGTRPYLRDKEEIQSQELKRSLRIKVFFASNLTFTRPMLVGAGTKASVEWRAQHSDRTFCRFAPWQVSWGRQVEAIL